MNTLPFAATWCGTRRPTQFVTETKCALSRWARCWCRHTGHGQVDRLAGLPCQQLERGRGKLDQALRAVLPGEAKEHRPRAQAPAAGAL